MKVYVVIENVINPYGEDYRQSHIVFQHENEAIEFVNEKNKSRFSNYDSKYEYEKCDFV